MRIQGVALGVLGSYNSGTPHVPVALEDCVADIKQSGVVTVAAFFLLRETYAPVLLARKVARLRKETGNTALCSKLDTGLSEKDAFLHSIIRPAKMFIFSPIVAMMCVYIAVAYGLLYILFT